MTGTLGNATLGGRITSPATIEILEDSAIAGLAIAGEDIAGGQADRTAAGGLPLAGKMGRAALQGNT